MSEISAITFDVGESTVQVCDGIIMIWKGIPDHPADCEISINAMRKIMAASERASRE